MAIELRKTGISVIGDIPWGTHFCSFYDTRDDLLDILVPYFQSGLESKEFCLWVISNSELLTVEEATSALRNALPDLDRHLAERSIELVGHDEWFFKGGPVPRQSDHAKNVKGRYGMPLNCRGANLCEYGDDSQRKGFRSKFVCECVCEMKRATTSRP